MGSRTARLNLAALAVSLILPGCSRTPPAPVQSFDVPLPVPPVLQPTGTADGSTIYDLNVRASRHAFASGAALSDTYEYSGSTPGPTIRLKRGERVVVNVHNELDQRTNMHWHGLRIPASADGPHHDIAPGSTWAARFSVLQPAGTMWYHPHTGNTGLQLYKGLAGFMYLDDEVSNALAIPKDYGVDDFPLLVQDKLFYPDGRLAYIVREGDEDRMVGDRIFVNGVQDPYLAVPSGLVRFRVLNGSNARRYSIGLADRRTFSVIASDGGFLPASRQADSVMLSPGERAEILVDFGGDPQDARVQLVSQAFTALAGEEAPIVLIGKDWVLAPNAIGAPFPLMEFRVTKPGTSKPVPAQLAAIERIPESEASATRTFKMEDVGEWTINGQKFDINRVDLEVSADATEIWTVTNSAPDFPHSFHIHGMQMQILDRTLNGVRQELPPLETGWKDTLIVYPQEIVRLIGRFHDMEGMYMFHCHVLEHEDGGMMGTFVVKAAGRPSPANHRHSGTR